MYTLQLVTLEELWDTGRTRQKSINALRERAKEDILWYVENRGAAWLFDLALSLVRENAGAKCKRPGKTWRRISIAMKALDKQNINREIIKILNSPNNSSAHKEAVRFVVAKLTDEIG